MNTYADVETVLQSNFPASQAGKLASVKYRVYELDSTGAPAIHIAQTNSGIMETEDGSYQIKLTLDEGRYSINWEITGTPYVANEEINVQENIYNKIDTVVDVYTGYGTGDRLGTKEINESLSLGFQVLRDGIAYSVYDMQKVEIFPTYDDAVDGTNVIETITSISEGATGLYSYTVSAFATAGTRFDRLTYIAVNGESAKTFISSFMVKNIDFTGNVVDSLQRVRVYLNLYDIIANPQENDIAVVKLNLNYAWYSKTLIEQEDEEFTADSNGLITMDLIETVTLKTDTQAYLEDTSIDVYYVINVAQKYFAKFRVPSGVSEINFKDCEKVEDE